MERDFERSETKEGFIRSYACANFYLMEKLCPCFRINRLHRWYDYETFTTIQ